MEKKRSIKYLLVSACLALLIACLGGIAASASTEVHATESLEIRGASLDLGDKIAIAFAVEAGVAGYDAEANTVQYNVYAYDTNPTGTANVVGDKLDFVVKNVGGTDYVMFITDGFAPVDYGKTVYARLEGEDGSVGSVKKAGIMELVTLLKNNMREDDPRADIKTPLYEAILAYGENAHMVVNETTSYPYHYITVENGYYLDSTGNAWQSGVVSSEEPITLVDTGINAASAGAYLAGWYVNGEYTEGNELTITADATLAPAYVRATYSDNPFLTGNNLPTLSNYTDTFVPRSYLNGILAGNEINKAGASVSYMQTEKVKNYKWGLGAALSANVTSNLINTFSYDAERGYVMNFEYIKDYNPKLATYDSATGNTTYKANAPFQMETQTFSYDNATLIDGSVTLSFDLMIPSRDSNNNGVMNDTGWLDNAENPETGDPIPEADRVGHVGDLTTELNGTILRIPIDLTTAISSGSGVNSSNVMYVHVAPVDATTKTKTDNLGNSVKVVNDFRIFTNANGADSNAVSQNAADFRFGFDEWVTISVTLTPDADGNVERADVYLNDRLAITRKSSNTGEVSADGFSANCENGTIKLAGDSKRPYIAMGIQDLGRTNALVSFSNFSCETKSAPITQAEVLADPNYGKTSGITIMSYDANGKAVYYDWNALNDGATGFMATTYNSDSHGYWKYNSTLDMVDVIKSNTTGQPGLFNVLFDNPLYGGKADWNGEAIVIEFTAAIHHSDVNGNGVLDEMADFHHNGGSSTVLGHMDFGYGTFDSLTNNTIAGNNTGSTATFSIAPQSGLLGKLRINRNNSNGSVVGWGLGYYTQPGDGNANVQSYIQLSEAIHVMLVITPDANGVPATISYYVNGGLIKTRNNIADTTGKDGFTWYDATTEKGAFNDIFAAKHISLSEHLMTSRAGTLSYGNFKVYSK